MTALARAVQTLHKARYDGETCPGCPTCYVTGNPNCLACLGTECASEHVHEIADEIGCEHGVLIGEVCERCWLEAQEVATKISDEEVNSINNPEVSR